MQNEQFESTNESSSNNCTTPNVVLPNNRENSCKPMVTFKNVFAIGNEQQQQQQSSSLAEHEEQQQQQQQQQQNDVGNLETTNKSYTHISIQESTLNRSKSCPQSCSTMGSVSSAVCRICQISENEERLISPCFCKGSLAYVHKKCLERWLSISGIIACELCHYQFRTKQKLRYTFIQSIRLWYRHPNNLGILQADFFVCSLLTIVSIGLFGCGMIGFQYFSTQGHRLGVSRIWSQFVILIFLCIIISVYIVNVFVIIKSQITPWYRWWRSAKIVTLVLQNRTSTIFGIKRKNQRNGIEKELNTTILSESNRTDSGTVAVQLE